MRVYRLSSFRSRLPSRFRAPGWQRWSRKWLPPLLGFGALALLPLFVLPSACSTDAVRADAHRITQRSDLIGGPRALGEVGDWMLENDKIRIIIQDEGFSRGFGVFGGSLIDADIVRGPGTVGSSEGGVGKDNFGEMFPTFFLEALEPTEVNDPNNQPGETGRLPAIEIENDGTNGEPAVLVVRGYGNDFLALTQQINEALLDDSRELPRILFETRYILRPGARYLEIATTVQNIIFGNESLTWDGGAALVGEAIPTPFGDVVLFGAGNKVFLPHEAGYDLRYRLEDIYQSDRYSLPALPGLVADFVASTGVDVSYGIVGDASAPPELNYALSTGQFEEAKVHSIHIPFIASAFTGVFQVTPPVLGPNDRMPGGDDAFTFRRFFIVGAGDVANVSDVAYSLLNMPTGTLSGELIEDVTRQPIAGAHVMVLQPDGAKVTECTTDDEGRYRANLPAGDYDLKVVKSGRAITAPVRVSIAVEDLVFQRLTMPQEARLIVNVSEPGVGLVPAKVTLVGIYGTENIGLDPKQHLFDLSLGEDWRHTDLVPDTEATSTRRYIETLKHAPKGQATIAVRPGTYTVFVTRGPEYDRSERPVTLLPGQSISIDVEIHRVVETPGYISADFHLHSRYSLDSDEGVHERLASYAGEGIEYVVATDHNFVVDYAPVLADMQYENFLQTAIGLELTTIDRGHFNGFPLRRGPGAVGGPGESGGYAGTIASRTYGSFQWARKTPAEIFAALRGLGRREQEGAGCTAGAAAGWPVEVALGGKGWRDDVLSPTACLGPTKDVVVQINHPRDSILGYFEQYGVDQDTLEAENVAGIFAPNVTDRPEFDAANMSWDFDAIEAFNGKRYEFLRNFTVPDGVTIDPSSCCPVVPGEVLRDFRRDFECDPEVRDCSVCLPADTDFQIAEGNCVQGGVAFPGAIDDWMSLLMTGKRVVGTANSDSHEHAKEEPGYPRTYVRVERDQPRHVSADDIVAAFAAGDILMTNGPFVTVTIGEAGMGATADVSAGATLDVVVRSSPWVVPNRVRVYRNLDLIFDQAIEMPVQAGAKGSFREQSLAVDLAAGGSDGFVVVEVTGQSDFFPSTIPNEIPPLQFTDVLGAIGGSFGFSTNPNAIGPDLTYRVTPYAMTNPIWIDGDGDGEVSAARVLPTPQTRGLVNAGPELPSELPVAKAWNESAAARFERLPARQQRALSRLPSWLWPSRSPRDVRRVLWQFVPHAH